MLLWLFVCVAVVLLSLLFVCVFGAAGAVNVVTVGLCCVLSLSVCLFKCPVGVIAWCRLLFFVVYLCTCSC